ncbi:amidase [Pseudomonas sp. TH05]|uniref:amidase n=1 Tax=unclassified Pseudomonas TaxID=196821 RepID=UPI0019130A14|nr:MULTISPECIES: amidase [unclassified Pseudomonas]MBK5539510.1 amidase [Pseudomonas sp. TH07]MBK5554947.1 amidase [Pseudomonas sp. TH05]
MSRSWVRRRPVSSLLLLLLAALLAWVWHERLALRAFPDILGAYSAKEYCSCRYVMQNPADYCLGYVRQYLPLSQFVDEPEHRRVTAGGLGRSHSAAWIGEREGCRLAP